MIEVFLVKINLNNSTFGLSVTRLARVYCKFVFRTSVRIRKKGRKEK
jgi:hypothetical protein